MKIAVIGTGHVGGTLGHRWAQVGNDVTWGSRHPESQDVQALLRESGKHSSADGVSAAVATAEVVVLAVPWKEAQNAIREAGDLRGKVLIDCTNVIGPDSFTLAVGRTTSEAEQIAGWAAGARVVKAFNTMGVSTMADPTFDGHKAPLYIAGDDAEAKRIVADLGREIGLEPYDTGPLAAARYLEPLGGLWVELAFRQGWGSEFCFDVLKRE